MLADVKTFRKTITEAAPDVEIINPTNDSLIERANAIGKTDVIVLTLGEDYRIADESHSRNDITLTSYQKELVFAAAASGKPVIGLITCGIPLAPTDVVKSYDALLLTWHAGTGTAQAATKIMLGDVCPSGKLSMTIPKSVGQIPLYYNCHSSGHENNGYYH